MRRRARAVLVAAAALAGQAALPLACASAPLPAGDGANLYRAKCGGCHRLYAPAEIREEGWDRKMDLMAKRAKLNEEETSRIRRYVEANRPPSPRPPG